MSGHVHDDDGVERFDEDAAAAAVEDPFADGALAEFGLVEGDDQVVLPDDGDELEAVEVEGHPDEPETVEDE